MQSTITFSMLLLLVVISAVGVVYTRHESRVQFVHLQELQSERDEMDIEWGQLQLEQSTWATHGRIEEVARENLRMHIPSPVAAMIIGVADGVGQVAQK